MRPKLLPTLASASLWLLLTACAASVAYTPASFTPITTTGQRAPVTLDRQIEVLLDTGYMRTLKADSQWTRMGVIGQGDVYKRQDAIFTLEGAHVHEAWLVVDADRLIGFYLPVERGFSPLKQAIPLSFSSTRHNKEQ